MSQEKLSGVRLYERYIKELGAIKEKNLHIPRFISQSNDTLRLIGTIFRLAQADASVLLLGESGSGKSYMARYIHENGPRRDLPFIAVNCASIPGELLESEFFGYDGGAFTGARRQGNTGFVELAGRGTLFLDEIAELSLPMQAKLLQVLQDGSYFKIGGRARQQMQCRIIAATNQNIHQLIDEKKFREDLYYRLSVFEVSIPPLRERQEEIVSMAVYFLNCFNKKYQRRRRLSESVLNIFLRYRWPGNARELENLIERLVVISKHSEILPSDLPDYMTAPLPEKLPEREKGSSAPPDADSAPGALRHITLPARLTLEAALRQVEYELLAESYHCHPSSYAVAEDLGISQSKANRLLHKHHLK